MRRWLRFRLVLDRVVAAVLLVVLSPLIAVLVVAIRLGDKGPGLLAVPRVGRNGVIFKMWKLRSMRVVTPDGRSGGPSLTAANDARITPIGVRMRAYYLDELPQLWNVVRGDMVLLGARPEAPEYVDTEDENWQAILALPPGMAGPTQLMVNEWERHVITECPDGATYVSTVLPVKLAIDRWYVESAGRRLDVLVSITLLRRFMPGSGSGRLKKLIRREVPQSLVVDGHHPLAATA